MEERKGILSQFDELQANQGKQTINKRQSVRKSESWQSSVGNDELEEEIVDDSCKTAELARVEEAKWNDMVVEDLENKGGMQFRMNLEFFDTD